MQLSKEQAEIFFSICKNILNMRQKAENMVERMQGAEESGAAEAYKNITNAETDSR